MAVDKDLLVVLKSAGLGEGEPDLAEKLMKSFLAMLLESGKIPARMIFMNSGIFLTTEGSAVIDVIKKFEEQGAEIFSCGTCLEYFQRKDKLIAGKAGNMRDTVNAMLSFARVLSP
ncbi:MAG TPA: sulfurtransferase-like selenium metabolism protein YedF [bacterium]|nr:sulfurtransferase-like selenium metabolism protein YedF [bacterium]